MLRMGKQAMRIEPKAWRAAGHYFRPQEVSPRAAAPPSWSHPLIPQKPRSPPPHSQMAGLSFQVCNNEMQGGLPSTCWFLQWLIVSYAMGNWVNTIAFLSVMEVFQLCSVKCCKRCRKGSYAFFSEMFMVRTHASIHQWQPLNKATPLTKWLAKWGKVRMRKEKLGAPPSFLSVMEYDSGSVGVFSCSRSIWFCEDPLAQFTDSDYNGIWDLRGEIRWCTQKSLVGLPFMGSHRVKCSNAL